MEISRIKLPHVPNGGRFATSVERCLLFRISPLFRADRRHVPCATTVGGGESCGDVWVWRLNPPAGGPSITSQHVWMWIGTGSLGSLRTPL